MQTPLHITAEIEEPLKRTDASLDCVPEQQSGVCRTVSCGSRYVVAIPGVHKHPALLRCCARCFTV